MNQEIIINNSNVWITRNKAVKNRLFLQKKVMERPRFYKMFKFWNWRIYITHNIRLRNREKRDYMRDIFNTKCFRKHCYERSGHKCEICGKEITYQEAQLHHILPFHKFQQFAMDERNMQILCNSCHNGIHTDPYKEIRQMEEKAKEFGINLKDYYEV